jgi:hypothetical protein
LAETEVNKSEWLASRCPNEAPAVDVERTRGILEQCATNQAAHFGGPRGTFVEVPVDALVELLNAHKDMHEALSLLVADVADYPAWQRPCHALDVALAALPKTGARV